MLIPQLLRANQNFAADLPDRQTGFKKRRRVWPAVGRAPPFLRQTIHGAVSS